MKPRRVVFDTNTVLSALLFPSASMAWLRRHWAERECISLASSATVAELVHVLAYPKFRLSADDRDELLADYLPYCEIVDVRRKCPTLCRDPKDQPFLDLAYAGNADLIVTGDRDLLVLNGKTQFAIEPAVAYRMRSQND